MPGSRHAAETAETPEALTAELEVTAWGRSVKAEGAPDEPPSRLGARIRMPGRGAKQGALDTSFSQAHMAAL